MSIKKLSKKEKEELIKNAISSFDHGIEHLVKESNDKNIKFSILHIFNSLELIIKAHLGEINEALLWENIDNGKGKKSLATYKLIDRVNLFSEYEFSETLIDNIKKLREKRNEIEHKEFIIENEQELMNILFIVVEEIINFSQEVLERSDINEKFIEKWKSEYVEPYMFIKAKFNKKFKKTMEEIDRLGDNNKIKLEVCNKCFLKTIPYKEEEGVVECLNCKNKKYYILCNSCGKMFFSDGEFEISFLNRICRHCSRKKDMEDDDFGYSHSQMEDETNTTLEESQKEFKPQEFNR